MSDVFLYNDYKAYLRDRLEHDKELRGNQKKLCQAIGINASFLSRVLHSHVQLTPEHAVGMTRFWKLPALDAQYFEELVNFGRAGTPLLRSVIEARIEGLKQKNNSIKDRLGVEMLDEKKTSFYYASYLHAAIHVLVSIPGFQGTEQIALRLGIPDSMAQTILEQLRAFKLLEGDGHHWHVGPSQVHLPRDSALQIVHQANWKHQAILDVQKRGDSLHYANVHSISEGDFQKLKSELLTFINNFVKTVNDSPAEKLACFNLDYFEV